VSATERRKGAEFEREVVRLLRERGWTYAGRSSDGRKQSARGDIVNGPAGCHLELKRHERLNVPKAFDQVMADSDGAIPILIHRPSRHEVMATLPLDELLPLLQLRESA
jgi:Holliday junction resolvase